MSGIGGARLYLVAGERLAAGRLADLVPELAAAGVDVVQLREKEMEAGEVLRIGAEVAAACEAAGIPFVVNDRPDIALALGSGVHLGQEDLPVEVTRRILPSGRIIGRSTHAVAEVDAEVNRRERVAYIAVGPVHATDTKPGRQPTGLGLLTHAARVAPASLPWFAIGGMNEETLPAALEAGARRIVVVRAITESTDPAAAAARLRALLDEVPLATSA